MDIAEAERYFKRYDGHAFHMGREEPSNYRKYQALGVSEKLEERWRQEMIDGYFEKLKPLGENTWAIHSRLIDILNKTKTRKRKNISRLLDVMETFTDLDLYQKALVTENMTGRGRFDGIIGLVRKCGYTKQLISVMEEIFASADADDADGKTLSRYRAAVSEYKNTLL